MANAAARPQPKITYEEVYKKIESFEKRINTLLKTPASASGVTPQAIFGVQTQASGYPTERLMKLAKAYGNDDYSLAYLKQRDGRPVGCGWGNALQAMARIDRGKSDWNDDRLEKEYGFVSIDKAKSAGIKQLNGEIRKVALAENSGVTGGYIVPPQYMNELLTIAAEDAWIEPRARVVPMTSRTMQYPILDVTAAQAAGTTPYYGGVLAQWQPEAASIDETEPAFKMTDFTAWDLVMYSVSSNQLLADNAVALDALLTQLFSGALTWYKEYAFLRGTGAGNSMPLGILNAPATIVQLRANSNAFGIVDAAAMLSRLQQRSRDSACWVIHQSVLPQLIRMHSGGSETAMLVWVNPVGSGNNGPLSQKLPTAFLDGLPLYVTEKVPALGTTGDVSLIDWSQYIIGSRLDMQIDVSTHALFRTNQTAWRVVSRLDAQPWLNSYITEANGSWTVSPFVTLSSATS